MGTHLWAAERRIVAGRHDHQVRFKLFQVKTQVNRTVHNHTTPIASITSMATGISSCCHTAK